MSRKAFFLDISMSRKYSEWSKEDLVLAVNAVRQENIGVNKAAQRYGVPQTTLKRYLKNQKEGPIVTKRSGRRPVFTEEMEKELVAHILKFEERFFGLTIKNVRKLAFDIAKMYGIPHCFNVENGLAGKKWFYKFMKRNSKLSLRQPEATSLARMRGFSKERVDAFFKMLEELVDKHKITGTKIYNVDESGFTTVQKKPQKIVGLKGKHQIGAASSGERGVNTTIVCCVSASGSFIPPTFIFKRKRLAPELTKGAPIGSEVAISDSGYITSELFAKWLRHFKKNVVCSKEEPVILLLDGHSTHSQNLEALLFARDNGIIMLQLPSHTTHRMQPLDVAFFRPLGIYYVQAQETYLRQHVGKQITQYDVVALLAEAYGRAATVGVAENAFKASGIWPVNRHVFKDHHFAASEALKEISGGNAASTPTCDNVLPTPAESFAESLNIVSPLPQAIDGTSRQRKQQDAEILTSTPYKENLEQQKRKTQEKAEAKLKRNVFADNSNQEKPKKKRTKLESDKREAEVKQQKIEEEAAAKLKRKEFLDNSKLKRPQKNINLSESDDTSEEFEASGSSSGGESFEDDLIGTNDFKDFDRNELKVNDYVIVCLQDEKKNDVYYAGQIVQEKSSKGPIEVSFLRKSAKLNTAFFFPAVPDVSVVDDCDVKMKLPIPQKHGQTKRQQASITFGIEFNFPVR